MRRPVVLCTTLLTLTILSATTRSAQAQGTSTSADSGVRRGVQPMPANDSLFRRARRMVSEGRGAAGRAIVDSLMRRAAEGTTSYGDALYWHGALAETAADAERDYRRVIVEYPLSVYADDALLALAELEQARGDRSAALQHLQRFVREHPVSSARGVAALAAGRLAFEQRDTRTACAMISEARASASTTDVELRNQIDYYSSRCPASVAASTAAPSAAAPSAAAPSAAAPSAAAVTPVAAPAATAKPAAPATAVAKKAVAAKPADKAAERATTLVRPAVTAAAAPAAVSARGSYTIQLAAYNTRVDADQLVKKLASRGVKARVSGTERPFRVRLAFYASREAAAAEAASLKARGIIGFVTTETPAREGTTP